MRIRITLSAIISVAALLTPTLSQADDARKPDAGKVTMTIQGTKAGTAAFKFDADGGCDADVAIDFGGQNQKIKIGVKAKGGKVINVSASAGPENRFTAAINGDTANVSIK